MSRFKTGIVLSTLVIRETGGVPLDSKSKNLTLYFWNLGRADRASAECCRGVSCSRPDEVIALRQAKFLNEIISEPSEEWAFSASGSEKWRTRISSCGRLCADLGRSVDKSLHTYNLFN